MSEPLVVVAKDSAEHKRWKYVQWLYLAGFLVLAPLVLEPFEIGKMNRALIMSVAILAVNLVVGFNGMLALGHSALLLLRACPSAPYVDPMCDDPVVGRLIMPHRSMPPEPRAAGTSGSGQEQRPVAVGWKRRSAGMRATAARSRLLLE